MTLYEEMISQLSHLIDNYDLRRFAAEKNIREAVSEACPDIDTRFDEIAQSLWNKVRPVLSGPILFQGKFLTYDVAVKQKLIDSGFLDSRILNLLVLINFKCLITKEENDIFDFLCDDQLVCSNTKAFCWECSSRYLHALDIEKKEIVVFKNAHKCVEIEPVFKTKLKINGKLGLANVVHSVNIPHDFDAPQLGTRLGDLHEMKRWAKRNVGRFLVGNSSPEVWRKDNEVLIFNPFENEDEISYDEACEKMTASGYEKIGKIITDAWTVCVFNGQAKADDAQLVIDMPFKSIAAEYNADTNIIKITGVDNG